VTPAARAAAKKFGMASGCGAPTVPTVVTGSALGRRGQADGDEGSNAPEQHSSEH